MLHRRRPAFTIEEMKCRLVHVPSQSQSGT
jgi:hypothetical protein